MASDEVRAFAQRWIELEPALWLAAQFAGGEPARSRFLALHVLLRELIESCVAVSDARVTEAKLSWWQDEAMLWLQGHGRHPLMHGLDAARCGSALLHLLQALTAWTQEPVPADAGQAWNSMRPMALTLAGWPDSDSDQVDVWQGLSFASALRLSGHARAPLATVISMDIWARHGLRRSAVDSLSQTQREALVCDAARSSPSWTLRNAAPAVAALAALELRWLRHASQGRPQSRLGPTAAWTAWRAARRALTG